MTGKKLYPALMMVSTLFIFAFYSAASVNKVYGKQIIQNSSAYENNPRNWNSCFNLDFDSTADKFWKDFLVESVKCEYKSPKLISFENHGEVKLGFLPEKNASAPAEIIVTLGVGQDIAAELKMKEELSKRSIPSKFYGADPMFLDNAALFESIGNYFPLAIGDSNGILTASVLTKDGYVNSQKHHLELIEYIRSFIKSNQIDHLWMDNEYAEYGLFPYFYKGGQLDKAGITVCQLNVEVHIPNTEQKQKFQAFVKRILEDNQWAFFKNVEASHYRIFMFHVGNDICMKKYLN